MIGDVGPYPWRRDPTLGVEDHEAGTDLPGEAEQVQFDAEAVVAFRFPYALLVGDRLPSMPTRAVDALQLVAVLVALPVGGRRR